MQSTKGISFREISLLENARTESKLSESLPYKKTQREDPRRENSLLVAVVALVGVALIAISATILIMVGSMLWLNWVPPIL